MSNVPLLCNICPKNPEFSDVSHLLTHVASKGHLSQYSKAKLRAHQDVSFVEKLEVYDHWYQRYQIERLLSERMIAKDSKDSSGRTRATKSSSRSTIPTKENKIRKSRNKVVEEPEPARSPVKIEGLVDPQLSLLDRAVTRSNEKATPFVERSSNEDGRAQTQRSPVSMAQTHQTNHLAFQSQSHHPYNHKAPIPYMSRWQGASSPLRAVPADAGADVCNKPPDDDTDDESDYFQTFLRSPTRTEYPDPSEVPCLRSAISISSSSPTSKENNAGRLKHESKVKDETSKSTHPEPQSPILRGIKWPGMSIFDSASLEAQRLRNQKKTDTVIERMEQSSASVEQLERIYWPDGSLKTQRLITGEVESSPIRELTPPSKSTKRRRPRVIKSVLTDLSNNVSRSNRQPRHRKVSGRIQTEQASDLQGISQRVLSSLGASKFIRPRSARMGHSSFDEADDEWRLTSGLPTSVHRREFEVFNDEGNETMQSEPKPQTYQSTSASTTRGRQHALHSSRKGLHTSTQLRDNSRSKIPLGKFREPQHRNLCSKPGSSFMNDDIENMEPISDRFGHEADLPSFANEERVTQRYFSITGNQQPQFFSSMPPGMDFGGTNEFRYHGSTLNPLNSYLRQPQSAYSPAHLTSYPSTHSLPLDAIYSGEHLRQPDLAGQGEDVAVRRPRS